MTEAHSAGENFMRTPMQERTPNWLIVLAVTAALALFASLRHGELRAGHLTPAAQRHAAPNMTLQRMDGGQWRLADHRGQVVLINLWASWCGPCREETPGLVRLYHSAHSQGLEIVGLSLDVGSRNKVQAFVRQFQVPYPIAFPEPMSQLASTVDAIPTTILIDRQGRVAKTYVGAAKQAVFEADVQELLREKEAVKPITVLSSRKQ